MHTVYAHAVRLCIVSNLKHAACGSSIRLEGTIRHMLREALQSGGRNAHQAPNGITCGETDGTGQGKSPNKMVSHKMVASQRAFKYRDKENK